MLPPLLTRSTYHSLIRTTSSRASITRQFRTAARHQYSLKGSVKVSNPGVISLLNLSKNIVKGIVVFYISALTIGLTGYGVASYYIEEKYSKEWPWSATIYSKLGIINQDFMESDEIAEGFFIKCLKSLNPDDGLPEGKFKLLTLSEFETKDPVWKDTYVNTVLRLAIVKLESGKDITNAKKLLLYAVNLPINTGDLDLKSKGLRYMSRLSSQEGDLNSAESYLLDDLRFNELYKSGITFIENGSNLLSLDSVYDEEVYQVLLELGKLYAVNEKTKSIEIFLNLLENFENSTSFQPITESDHSIKPMLRVYIGELLYTKGLIHKSVDWNLHSYNDLIHDHNDAKSYDVLRQATGNLAKLYKELGDEVNQEKFYRILDGLKKPVDTNLFRKLF